MTDGSFPLSQQHPIDYTGDFMMWSGNTAALVAAEESDSFSTLLILYVPSNSVL